MAPLDDRLLLQLLDVESSQSRYLGGPATLTPITITIVQIICVYGHQSGQAKARTVHLPMIANSFPVDKDLIIRSGTPFLCSSAPKLNG